MQAVSELYKESMNSTFRGRSRIYTKLEVENLIFKDLAVLTDNGHLSYSNVQGTNDPVLEVTERYTQCELNANVLMGNNKILPLSPTYQGFVGNGLSGEDCIYSIQPKITITSDSNLYDLAGIYLEFDLINDEYPRDFDVIGYNGSTVVTTYNITDNTLSSIQINAMNQINKIEIIFKESCIPKQRAILTGIYMGVRVIYTNDEIITAKQFNLIDVLQKELTQNKFEFKIDNVNYSYNPDNPTNVNRYFQENQRIEVEYEYEKDTDIWEKVKGGVYYLDGKPVAEKNEARFTAVGLFNRMTKLYTNGIYNANEVSYYSLMEAVFNFADLPLDSNGNPLWTIDTALQTKMTKCPLPKMKCNELIQLMCNATGYIVKEDVDGKIHIVQSSSSPVDYKINTENQFENPKNEYIPVLKNLIVYKYAPSVAASATELYNATLNIVGTQTIKLNYSPSTQQALTLTGSGTFVSSSYKLEYGEVVINGTGSCTLVLNGKSVEMGSTVVTTVINDTGEDCEINNAMISNDTVISDLITSTTNYLTKRRKYESTYRGEPAIAPNDIILLDSQFVEDIEARIVSNEISFNGALRGKLVMREV